MRRKRSQLAKVGLGLVGAALLLDCAALLLDIVLGLRLVDGVVVPESDLERSSMLSGAANLAVPAAVLVCGVLFVWWFHRAYTALSERAGSKLKPIWAIVGWFVPGLNLVRPPSIMNELAGRRDSVVGWWVLWLVGAFVQFVLRLVSPADQLGWVYWQTTALAANVVLLISVALAAVLVGAAESR